VPTIDQANDPFLKLADGLRELEIVVRETARPAIGEVRETLRAAMASRERGDTPQALAEIRRAMEQLAALGTQMDPGEGAMMREVARIFAQSLSLGDKGAVKQAVGLMRHKAGDPKDDDPDW